MFMPMKLMCSMWQCSVRLLASGAKKNPDLKGNIRDYASINELICLSNMESFNAVFIEQGMPQSERLVKLNQIAIHQM